MSENTAKGPAGNVLKDILDRNDANLGRANLIRELVDLHRLTENILRNMNSGLIAINGIGTVTHFNEQAASITGFSAAEAIGRPGALVFRTAVPGPSLLDKAMTTEFGDGEVDILTKDERVVPVGLRLTPLEDEHGARVGAVGIFVDLTDAKRGEEQARRRDRLVSLGELSAGVAHEIRNPLAGIGASAQVLKKRLDADDDRVRFANIILEETARLDKIVESLLSFARPARPHLSESDVTECITKVLALVTESAEDRAVTIETSIEQGIPRIHIDHDQIVQVLLNLAQNALQAMPEGGRLTIRLRRSLKSPYVRRVAGRRATDRVEPPREARPMEFVELAVEDTGDGIPKETLERIFDPFFTTRRDGTGLGLSISQSIIREHGGTISIHSTVGRGTTATIHLPLEKRHGQRRRG